MPRNWTPATLLKELSTFVETEGITGDVSVADLVDRLKDAVFSRAMEPAKKTDK